MHRVALLALALALGPVAAPQSPSSIPPKDPGLRQAKEVLQLREAEVRDLKAKASAVTAKIGELASSGKLPQDEAGIQELRRLVDQLAEMNKRLSTVEGEITRIQRYLEGLDETLPRLTRDVELLRRHREGNYVQFQYRSSDQRGGPEDGFRMRRVRLGFTDTLDSKTSFRVTFDLAANPNLVTAAGSSGAVANTDQNAQLRDAYLDFTVNPSTDARAGTVIRGGQFNTPLGYDVERSSAEREFPERAQYNLALWPGERNRGVMLRTGLGKGFAVHLALMNALGVNDAEQRSVQGSPGSNLGTGVGLRYASPKMNLGLSAFAGERAGQQAGYRASDGAAIMSEDVNRRLFYLDGEFVNVLVPGLTFRGEAMMGHDRPGVQTVTTSRGSNDAGITDPASRRLRGRDVAGYQAQLTYALNARNRIAVRYEQWDPDLSRGGDLFRGYGLAYLHNLNPSARITLAHEIFEDDARRSLSQVRFGVTTLRVQYRF